MKESLYFRSIISGGYGLYNFGDDALMFAIYKRFESKFQSKEAAFQCLNPSYLKKLTPNATVVSRLSQNKIICDNFILGGGTLFYSFSGEKKKSKVNIFKLLSRPSELYLKLLIKLKIAKLKYEPDDFKKVYSLGIGLGPFDNGIDKRKQYAIDFLKKSEWTSVRDEKSLEYLEEWNIDNRYLGADICFHPNIFCLPERSVSKEVKKIGIIVRDWDKNENGSYKDSLLKMIENLRVDYEITFIVFSEKSDQLWMDTLKSKDEDYILWNPNKQTINEFLKIMNEFDLFISARYHGFIFASLLNIPTICVEIEPKLALAHSQFEESSELWSFPFSEGDLISKIKKIETNKTKFKESLANDVSIRGNMAESMFNEIEKLVF